MGEIFRDVNFGRPHDTAPKNLIESLNIFKFLILGYLGPKDVTMIEEGTLYPDDSQFIRLGNLPKLYTLEIARKSLKYVLLKSDT